MGAGGFPIWGQRAGDRESACATGDGKMLLPGSCAELIGLAVVVEVQGVSRGAAFVTLDGAM